jgi:hypothetical protein
MAISWTPYNGTAFPTFGAGDITWNAPQGYQGWGDGPANPGQGSWGITPGVETPSWFSPQNIRWGGDAANPSLGIKTGEGDGTWVPYSQQGGSWAPDLSQAQVRGMNTAVNPDGILPFLPLLAPLAVYAAGAAGAAAGADGLGSAAGWTSGFDLPFGTASGAASAAPAATGGAMNFGLVPEMGQFGTTLPLSGGGAGLGTSAASWGVPEWLKAAGSVMSAGQSLMPGGPTGSTGSGNALGGLLGGVAGYFDAKSQPDSLTVRNEIDPRLAQVAYGPGGVSEFMSNLLKSQGTSLNPYQQQGLDMAASGANAQQQAGQQIAGLPKLPDWQTLVQQNQQAWGANPFIEQQQRALTDSMTRNLRENVLPGVGNGAQMAGGFGGSRQGVAEALAMSRMNQDLAPALTGLASNAWENSQSRALTSAGANANYGLNQQQQQSNNLSNGANLQFGAGQNLFGTGTNANQAPWQGITNATNVLRALPGNSSRTEPLFNNPYAGAIGGASLGSQVAGTDWGKLFNNAGDAWGGLSNLFGKINWGG